MAGFFSKLFGGSGKPAGGTVPQAGTAKAAAAGSPVEAVRAKESRWNLFSLTQPMPYYRLGDISIVDAIRDFYVDVPEDMKAAFRAKNPDIVFHRDKSFDGFHYYSDIPMRSGIYDLVERINRHRLLAAQEWLASGEVPVNRPKLGVLHINPYGKTGRAGENALELQIFRTDAFTHRVFRSVYKELQAANHEMLTMKTATEVNRYNAFLTELKVHAWVTLPSDGSEAIVPGSQTPAGATLYGELLEEDLQAGTSHFSLVRWLSRHLAEAAGRAPSAFSELESAIRGYELFVDKADYSVCLTVSVALKDAPPALADKAVPFTGDEVARLIQQPMSPAGEYTLRLVAARKGIDLD
ncbi:hypothetical protein HM1_0769 [Heliomicrobium modesticaldum Ice1]|uniref:Uncharacterized protein n=1 Tax=Heliobacterium modesticaldum (strain ATCC 51547 / Ice1) TaxID=498761 RepID=B0TB59_HELMI|nr:hypothetical protein [Heliomicrobium modesticaldum]ABZ83786.1 hypothetical protein HM1_0769 [Heliomicrobium modesticaldum Ice1]